MYSGGEKVDEGDVSPLTFLGIFRNSSRDPSLKIHRKAIFVLHVPDLQVHAHPLVLNLHAFLAHMGRREGRGG